MQNKLLILIFGIFICACTATKQSNDKTKYFDENNVEISRSKFNKIRSTNKRLTIAGDSVDHKKLTLRENQGKITNKPMLESLLEKAIDEKIDASKPIVIIYYPGKDPCNSGGSATKESIHRYQQKLMEGVYQITQTKPIYIYKDKAGLEKYDGYVNWYKDPEGIIEGLFFEYHYPCQSFVVISKDGNYISYFGEFRKEYLWEAIRLLNK